MNENRTVLQWQPDLKQWKCWPRVQALSGTTFSEPPDLPWIQTCLKNKHKKYMFLWCVSAFCRTSPWLCTCVTTGRTRGWRSRLETTRAGLLTPGWWRRSGFLTSSSSTPNVPSSTTPPWRTSCCGFTLMEKSSTASGRGQVFRWMQKC